MDIVATEDFLMQCPKVLEAALLADKSFQFWFTFAIYT